MASNFHEQVFFIHIGMKVMSDLLARNICKSWRGSGPTPQTFFAHEFLLRKLKLVYKIYAPAARRAGFVSKPYVLTFAIYQNGLRKFGCKHFNRMTCKKKMDIS
jgi:hypothetical protein